MYALILFLHVLGVFAFLMAHGVPAVVSFLLRDEHDLARIRALLLISGRSHSLMYPALLVIVLTGIINGFQGRWWSFGWIWVSLVLLVALLAAMFAMGGQHYSAARKAAGLPYFENGKPQPPVPPSSQAEVEACIRRLNPMLLGGIGFGGLAVIAWLMLFKPF